MVSRRAPAAADAELVEDVRGVLVAWQHRLAGGPVLRDLAEARRIANWVNWQVFESSRAGTALTLLRPAVLVTSRELAERRVVSPSTLARWAASGEVTGRKFELVDGRGRETWVVDLNDVERKLRERGQ